MNLADQNIGNSFAYSAPGLKFRDQMYSLVDVPNKIEITKFTVCNFFGLKFEALTTISRQRHLVVARALIMHFLRVRLKLSLHDIGTIFNRDHTTVIHAMKMVQNLREFDSDFEKQFKQIQYLLS